MKHGGEIWTTCPVAKIIVENGRAVGIKLSDDAVMPGEEIRAKNIVSNLTLTPTFTKLLGEEVIARLDAAHQVLQLRRSATAGYLLRDEGCAGVQVEI